MTRSYRKLEEFLAKLWAEATWVFAPFLLACFMITLACMIASLGCIVHRELGFAGAFFSSSSFFSEGLHS